MKKYKANIMIANELELIKFQTKENPIEHIWTRYGMDSYIEYIEQIEGFEEMEQIEGFDAVEEVEDDLEKAE